MENQEVWKDIEDYTDYQVSTMGLVKSSGRHKSAGGYIWKFDNNK